jgi:nitroimidazol reductase NimA-like FMN-containing flavoprotein (pyridoxamine 5'-phosphate oxidase superfamily)
MPKSRDAIAMTTAEADAFLDAQTTVICATNGSGGWPHLMPLWYALRPTGPDGATELWAWTFAKSQKTANLRRDPRATLQVEAGTEYRMLRGVMIETEVEVVDDVAAVEAAGREILGRQADVVPGTEDEVAAAVRAQAPKRVALRFVERRRVSWDHRKLP